MGIDCSMDFLPDAKHLSMVDKSAFADFSVRLHGHIHNCLVEACRCSSVQRPILNLLTKTKEILQNALKTESSLLQQRKAVKQLRITSCKMTVHIILFYPSSGCHEQKSIQLLK